MNANLCLLLNATSTWAMVGLIWLIQIVHYPLFARVGEATFARYSADHRRLITYIVLPLMFCELITSVMLWWTRPSDISQSLVIAGIVLVVAIWASTFLIQVPQHGKLSVTYDVETIRSLVRGNWIRTVAWSLHGLLSAYMVWLAMK